jgi:GNAT superfamily N-acetyltransferase
MQNATEQLSTKVQHADPIIITKPEPWQWDILAKAFLNDPTLNFWLGEKTSEQTLSDYFEAMIKDTLVSGGAVFASPDQKAVLIWTWLGRDPEDSNEFKKKWHDVLDPDGVKRYYWLYDEGELDLDPDTLERSFEPAYMGVHPDSQGKGYGGHLLKSSLNYFEERGYEAPYILASTRRSAKLYCPLVGFHHHKEVFAAESDSEPVAVYLKRNK